MRPLCYTIIAFFILLQTITSQTHPPKREFRGVWIATVANIDYPSQRTLSSSEQQEEWEALMDFYKSAGFNAVIAQIRPASDAFYPSKLAPWSSYLTGNQGVAPSPLYDPLEFMIEAAHQRGIEFHAWLNPYRATMDLNLENLHKMHPLKQHPEWGVPYGDRYYLNPALPQVRDYITEIVGEILFNYEVDAIHFDDYFYPYKIKDLPFPDSLEFEKYSAGFFYKEDWRRNNVDLLIEQISKKIKSLAPEVKFGISPFGVWRNARLDPLHGSNTRAGQTCYDDLYADILKWLEEGWIDYVAPQIYWHIGFELADYEVLANWWAEHHFDRHLYIGHAGYKVATNPQEAWSKPDEISKQILLNRSLERIGGSIFFSSKSMQRNPLGVTDSLSQNYFAEPALLPQVLHFDLPQPNVPILEKVKWRKGKARLRWQLQETEERLRYCIIYRFEADSPENFDDPANILAITEITEKEQWEWYDESTSNGKTYTYVVSVLNRQHMESDLSDYRVVRRKGLKLKRIR